MEEGRLYYVRNKPRVILDKRFPFAKEVEVGDKGQALFNGVIVAERIERGSDQTDWFIKKVRLSSIEKLKSREYRV